MRRVEIFVGIFQFFVWGYVQVCLLASRAVGGSRRSNLFPRVPEVCSFALFHVEAIFSRSRFCGRARVTEL